GLVVVEATGKLHRLVLRGLTRARRPVAVVNPLRARRFAQGSGELAKTDAVDAKMLAVMGAALGPPGKLPAAPPTSKAVADPAEIVRTRSEARAERRALQTRRQASQNGFVKKELAGRIQALDRHIERLRAEASRRVKADPALARRFEILVSIPGV